MRIGCTLRKGAIFVALGMGMGVESFNSRAPLNRAFHGQLCGFGLDFDVGPQVGLFVRGN